jgi:two-component system response regulator AtoC
MKYSWPGNIRELENLVKSYVVFESEEDIRSAMRNVHENFFDPQIPPNGIVSLKQVVRAATKQLERTIIRKALETHHWNRRKAARALCISYAGLLCKMREAGMPPTRGPKAYLEIAESQSKI